MPLTRDKLGKPIGQLKFNVALSTLEGCSVANITGFNEVMPTGYWSDLTYYTENLQHLTQDSTVNIQTYTGDDGPGGTGARTVRLSGLDPAGNELVEDYTLASVGVVSGTKVFSKINSLVVTSAGSDGFNDNTIVGRPQYDSSVEVIAFPGGRNRTEQGSFWVPAGHTFIITGMSASLIGTTAGQLMDLRVTYNPGGGSYIPLVETRLHYTGVSNVGPVALPAYASFDEGTHILIQGKPSGSNCGATANLMGYLVQNDKIGDF